MSGEPFVFISYARAELDSGWARQLHEHLVAAGCRVFLDVESQMAGDNYVAGLNRVLADCSHAVVLMSEAANASSWVELEISSLIPLGKDGQVRVIPLVLGGTLPPLLAVNQYIDLRDRNGPDDVRRALDEVLRAVRGEPSPATVPGPLSVLPPDLLRRPEGPRRVAIRVGPGATLVRAWGEEAEWLPDASSSAVRDAVLDLDRVSGGPAERLQEALHELGDALGAGHLGGPAGALLRREIEDAERQNGVVQVSLEIPAGTGLDALAWEALRPESRDRPLALEPRVQVHRTVSGLGPVPDPVVPGPLRVLAVIAGPEGDDGDLLDHEAELERILAALGEARKRHGVSVRILEWGSAAEIRRALLAERFHVLHVSCRAAPGVLLLEDAEGRPDSVDVQRFADEVLVPDRGVPLVVLAGCTTALDDAGGAVQGFARGLLDHGVPAVLAMTRAVTDRYAIRFAGRFYGALAERREAPDPLAALADARREVERDRAAAGGEPELGEWHVPVLYLRGLPRPLHPPAPSASAPEGRALGRRGRGFRPRGVSEMVGRRSELRSLLRVLGGDRPAVLVRGLGGVGKTTLAERLAETVVDEGAHLLVTVQGRVTPTEIVSEIGRQLGLRTENRLEDDPLRRAARALRDREIPWRENLRRIEDRVLPELTVTLILDEAEQNLRQGGVTDEPTADDPELVDLLAEWLDLMPETRLIVTSRTRLPLPRRAQQRLTEAVLGPLSHAEALKLFWRLPGIDALGRAEQERAYADVGGHPRALQYLDALLRGRRPADRNVFDRMERALAARRIEDAEAWLAGERGLDKALAETVTMVSSDVLLERLLAGLRGPSRDLFVASSVYRQPVDRTGLNWVLAGDGGPPDEARDARLREAYQQLEAAQLSGRGRLLEHLGLPYEMLTRLMHDGARGTRPDEHPGLDHAVEELLDRSLLTGEETGGDPRYLVHRWTASGLGELIASGVAGMLQEEDLLAAHRRAAAHHEWRADVWGSTVRELLEARHHHHAAGALRPAAAATAGACAVLFRWGEFDHLEALCRETLTWVPDGAEAIELLHLQSLVAGHRGSREEAARLSERCREIAAGTMDRRWIATCEQQLGVVAQADGDFTGAEQRYRAALAIAGELQDRALTALCYLRLGALALARNHDDDARSWSLGAAGPLWEGIRHHAEIARGLGQLRDLARAIGTPEVSARLGRRVARRQEADRELQRAGAEGMQQLGEVALRRENLPAAEEAYELALAVAQQLDDRVLEMDCLLGLGRVAQRRGRFHTARGHLGKHLRIADTVRDREATVDCYHALGELASADGDRAGALRWHGKALALANRIGDERLVGHAHLRLARARAGAGEDTSADLERAEDLGRALGAAGAGLVTEALLGRAEAATDQDEAGRLYQQARTSARDTGDTLGVARCELGLAAVSRRAGDLRDAESHARNAEQDARGEQHWVLVCDALLELGTIAEQTDDPATAARRYEDGLAMAERIPDGERIADFSLRRGHLARDREAFGWYDRALERLEELPDRARAARTRVRIGEIALRAFGDVGRAEADFHQVIAMMSGWSSVTTVDAYLGLGAAALAEGRAGDAESAYRSALAAAAALPAPGRIAACRQALGVTAQLRDDLTAAAGQHEAALRDAEELGPAARWIAMEARRDLARLARRQGAAGQARAGYQAALRLAEELGDALSAVACAQQLALLHEEAGEDAAAGRVREQYPLVLRYPLQVGQNTRDAELAASRDLVGRLLTGSGRPDEAAGFTAPSLVYQRLWNRESYDGQLAVLRLQHLLLPDRLPGLLAALLDAELAAALLEDATAGEG